MPFNLIGQQASSGHQPGIPTIGTATAGDGSATVTFTAPSYLGKPIGTTYTATSTPGGITGTGSSSPISITGLTNGISYTFKIKLSNSITSSLESNASNSVTPAGAFSVFGFTPTPPPAPTVYYASGCCNVVGANPYATQAVGTTSSDASINLAGTCIDGYITNEQISTTGYPSVNCNPTPFSVFGFTPTPPAAFSVFGFTPTPFSSDYSWLDGGTALAPDLTVRMFNNFLDSKNIDDINVGDSILTMDINTFSIHKTQVIETFNIESDLGILIDGDVFLPEFKILARKDNRVEFISVAEIDTTYQKYSYLQNDFVDIFIVEEIDAPLASKVLKCDKEYFFVGSSLISVEKYAK